MKKTNICFLALVLVFIPISAVKANINDASLFVNIDRVSNCGRGNMTSNIFVGSNPLAVGAGSATIPLTLNGFSIIDPVSTDNVPGIHITRGQGYIIVSSYGFNRPNDREIVKADITITNAVFAGRNNTFSHPFENINNGICGIKANKPCQSNPADDQVRVQGNAALICSVTNTDQDSVKIFYTINQPPLPPIIVPPPVTPPPIIIPPVIIPQPNPFPNPFPINGRCNSSLDCPASGLSGSPFCQAGSVMRNLITYSCANPGTSQSFCQSTAQPQLIQQCSNSQVCNNGACADPASTCSARANMRCVANGLYWFDSCGVQGSLIQNCQYGCSGNACNIPAPSPAPTPVPNPYPVCTPNVTQRCVGNQIYSFDSCGNQGALLQYCQYGCNNGYCASPQNQYGNVLINQTVRNLSYGSSGWASMIYANPGDTLMFMVSIQNQSNQDMQGVSLRDNFPQTLIYQDQIVVSGATNSYGGNLISGITINTIPAGQTVTVTYQAQLAGPQSFPYGQSAIRDNLQIYSTNMGNIPVNQATVTVNKTAIYGATLMPTGLTNNFLTDSFFLPMALALLLLWGYKSKLFGIKKFTDKLKFGTATYYAEKALNAKIAQIRKLEVI